jgi:hypothetical protein
MASKLLIEGCLLDRLAQEEFLFLGSLAQSLLLFVLQINLALVLALLGSHRFDASCLLLHRSYRLRDLAVRYCLAQFEDVVFLVRLLCSRPHCQNHQNFYMIQKNF